MGTVALNNATVEYFRQTSGFIRALKPPHVILVHGEANEMNRLKNALIREYEAEPQTKARTGWVAHLVAEQCLPTSNSKFRHNKNFLY